MPEVQYVFRKVDGRWQRKEVEPNPGPWLLQAIEQVAEPSEPRYPGDRYTGRMPERPTQRIVWVEQ